MGRRRSLRFSRLRPPAHQNFSGQDESQIPSDSQPWEAVASFHPAYWRRWTARTNLTSRLVRDGFHALASAALERRSWPRSPERSSPFARTKTNSKLPTESLAARVRCTSQQFPAARSSGESISTTPPATKFISTLPPTEAMNWDVAYTFPKRAIRHVHNIVHDPWGNASGCSPAITATNAASSAPLTTSAKSMSSCKATSRREQSPLSPLESGLYFSSDTPLEENSIYHLDRQAIGSPGKPSQLAPSPVRPSTDAASDAMFSSPPWSSQATRTRIAPFASTAAAMDGTGIPYSPGKKTAGPCASSNTATPSCPMARTTHLTWR